jgi:hypothetical protein
MHYGRVAYCVPGEDLVIEPPPPRARPDAPLQVQALRFGRMFGRARDLPPPDGKALHDRLVALGLCMSDPQTHCGQPPPQEDGLSDIPAGYTYLGQFIAHEVTFDSTRSLLAAGEPFKELRTPQLELDSLYGKSEGEKFVQRELYDGPRLRVGETFKVPSVSASFPNDLHREPGADPAKAWKAVVGDERNDENLPLAQTHLAFVRFHNKIVDALAKRFAGDPDGLFREARREVVRHFQWIVLYDYLPHVVDAAVLDSVLRLKEGEGWFKRDEEGGLFMPLEFSAAAFRIGHSMVRRTYQWNDRHSSRVLKGGVVIGLPAGLLELFQQTERSGNLGGRPRLASDWVIDWRRFYDFRPLAHVPAAGALNLTSKLDTNLNLRLNMIRPADGEPPPADKRLDEMQKAITVRNLLRGFYTLLPTGEEVAECMQETPLTPDEVAEGPHRELLSDRLLRGRTPLWYYILKEAELQGKGNRLGRVGSRIVAETLVGLVRNSEHSVFEDPDWRPTYGARPGTPADPRGTRFGMIDLLDFVDIVNPVGG